MLTKKPIILDACCLFNILVSGYIEDILSTIPNTVFVSEVVYTEEIQNIKHSDDLEPSIEILEPVIKNGNLNVTGFRNDFESRLFEAYWFMMDKGESASLAIAQGRDYILATDDRKARKKSEEEESGVELAYTLEIIKLWSEIRLPNKNCLSQILKNIKKYGSYYPNDNHPLKSWWDNNIK